MRCRAVIMSVGLCFFLASSLSASSPVEVSVEGVKGDPLKNVKEALSLPYGLVREGKVDRLWLERFAKQAEEKARIALEPFGYYKSQVTITIEERSEGNFNLLVKVVPGEAVILSGVTVTMQGAGAKEKQMLEARKSFPLKKGDTPLHQKYEEAKEALLSRAKDLGFLDADLATHEIRINESLTTAEIKLVVETGERYYFDGAEIEGAPEYPDRFLRRYLTFKSGEVFSFSSLGESQLNFYNSERFKEVIFTPEKEISRDFHVPIRIELKPAPRRTIRTGVGYGTDMGGRITLNYRDLNIFHLGHELYSNLFLAERLQGLATGYVFPSYRDIRSSTVVQLNLQREEVKAYVSRLIALEFDRNHSFSRWQLGTAYLRLQQEDFVVGQERSGSRLILPGFRFSEDRKEDLKRLKPGFRYSLEARGTHRFLGSETKLAQVIVDGGYLFSLPARLSLHARVRSGTTFFSDPLGDIPLSLRFFAGGDYSVRGYSYKSLGPRDAATGLVVGGKQLLAGSLELERRIFQSWGLSVFHDAGNAFNSYSGISLYQGAGVGLHYYTRVGELNLSLARQIGVERPGFRVHFTVGFLLRPP